jgi:hypothetical protein
MMSILLAGVVAELIMLPALLAGPLGKAFKIRSQAPKPGEIPLPPLDDDLPPREVEQRPLRKEPARVLVENGQPELTAGRHQPHAFTLRDRLAGLRRSARDSGKP